MPVYYGVNGKARLVTRGYYGINGKSELIIGSGEIPSSSGCIQHKYLYSTYNYSDSLSDSLDDGIHTYRQIIYKFVFKKEPYTMSWERYLFALGSLHPVLKYNSTTKKSYLEITKGSNSWTSPDLSLNTEYTINLCYGDCYFNNTKIFNNTQIITTDSSVQLIPYQGQIEKESIYFIGMQIYDQLNKKILKKYIPCIQNGSTAGVWDTIGKKFLTGDYLNCSN